MAFPASPVGGQTYTATNGTKYTYNATVGGWIITSSGGSSFDIHALTTDAAIATTDELPFYDVSEGVANKLTLADLKTGLGGGGKLLASGALASAATVDVLNIGGWESIRLLLVGGTSGVPRVYVSANNGSSFYNTVGDYTEFNAAGGVELSSAQILPNFRTGNVALVDFVSFGTSGQTVWLYHGGTTLASAAGSYSWGVGPFAAMNALRLYNTSNPNSYTYYVFGCNAL